MNSIKDRLFRLLPIGLQVYINVNKDLFKSFLISILLMILIAIIAPPLKASLDKNLYLTCIDIFNMIVMIEIAYYVYSILLSKFDSLHTYCYKHNLYIPDIEYGFIRIMRIFGCLGLAAITIALTSSPIFVSKPLGLGNIMMSGITSTTLVQFTLDDRYMLSHYIIGVLLSAIFQMVIIVVEDDI